MGNLLDSFFSSGVVQQLRWRLLLQMYPWIPFVAILVVGVIVTLIIVAVRSRKKTKTHTNSPVGGGAYNPVVQPPVREETVPINPSPVKPQPRVQPNVQRQAGRRSLACVAGALKGRDYPVNGRVSIGRDPQRCQIVFPKDAKGVSAFHCTLVYNGASVQVIDENSRFGTFINGKRIPQGVATTLHRGQMLSIGSASNAFELKGH